MAVSIYKKGKANEVHLPSLFELKREWDGTMCLFVWQIPVDLPGKSARRLNGSVSFGKPRSYLPTPRRRGASFYPLSPPSKKAPEMGAFLLGGESGILNLYFACGEMERFTKTYKKFRVQAETFIGFSKHPPQQHKKEAPLAPLFRVGGESGIRTHGPLRDH